MALYVITYHYDCCPRSLRVEAESPDDALGLLLQEHAGKDTSLRELEDLIDAVMIHKVEEMYPSVFAEWLRGRERAREEFEYERLRKKLGKG